MIAGRYNYGRIRLTTVGRPRRLRVRLTQCGHSCSYCGFGAAASLTQSGQKNAMIAGRPADDCGRLQIQAAALVMAGRAKAVRNEDIADVSQLRSRRAGSQNAILGHLSDYGCSEFFYHECTIDEQSRTVYQIHTRFPHFALLPEVLQRKYVGTGGHLAVLVAKTGG